MLPEKLCDRLTALAESESRTVSNMAKVMIQQGIERYEQVNAQSTTDQYLANTEGFRSQLEAQQPKRLRGAPRRLRLYRPS